MGNNRDDTKSSPIWNRRKTQLSVRRQLSLGREERSAQRRPGLNQLKLDSQRIFAPVL
jgi:hypothetical protein